MFREIICKKKQQYILRLCCKPCEMILLEFEVLAYLFVNVAAEYGIVSLLQDLSIVLLQTDMNSLVNLKCESRDLCCVWMHNKHLS